MFYYDYRLLLSLVAIVLSSLLIYFINYSNKEIFTIFQKYGFTVADEQQQLIKSTFIKNSIINGLLLTVLMWFFHEYVPQKLGVSFFISFTPVLLLMLLGKRIVQNFRSDKGSAMATERVIAEPDTLLEAQLIVKGFEDEGIVCRMRNSRYVEFSGTDSLWYFSRPRHISFSIYPFFGNGRLEVIVPEEYELLANEHIKAYESVE